MKTLKIIGIVSLLAVVLVVGVVGWVYAKYFEGAEENYTAHFLANNPHRTAFVWLRNGKVEASANADKVMPLASTVKVILAITFAKQAAEGTIKPNAPIALAALDPYYLANTDGNAHPNWLEECRKQGLIHNDSIPLLEVAKGMITFSSNANTEFLLDKLGEQNVNQTLHDLGLKQHQELYPVVSALLVCQEAGSVEELKKMPLNTYVALCRKQYQALKNEPTTKKNFKPGKLSTKIQRVWSDNLTGATANEYANIMSKVQSRSYFDANIQKYLDELLEWPLRKFPNNRKNYSHLGGKGGSTAFVLTYALYGTDKAGNESVLITFFNDLDIFESGLLQGDLSDFQRNVLSKPETHQTLKGILRTSTSK